MKKEALLRGLLGVPLGIALGHIISLLASLGLAGGEFSPCVPSLVQAMGSEVAAVALQTGLSGLLGAAFGAGSVVWSLDHWSLVKQTGVYFLIGSLAMLPIAYLAHWMEHSLRGILGYFLIYLAIFAGIWANFTAISEKRPQTAPSFAHSFPFWGKPSRCACHLSVS